MNHQLSPAGQAVFDHLRSVFPEHETVAEGPWPGPIRDLVPDLHIVRVRPRRDRRDWLYVTASLWHATQRHGHALDFALFTPEASPVHVETLTMTAFYHASGGRHELDLGHTVPIGRPWLPGSKCSHLLVSLPYLWGPALENCRVPEGHTRILWLLPISKEEKRFRHAHGLEALEQKLQDAAIDPVDPHRSPVIPAPQRRWWFIKRRA
ncbi:MAG TPA: suppressor of fused domain protein [Candidatus Limnocylindrales bacterium]|nr:suppressor of fused domain protein [Candidatus Limnocylindrales bacterium]